MVQGHVDPIDFLFKFLIKGTFGMKSIKTDIYGGREPDCVLS
jgi:hypothetical protein